MDYYDFEKVPIERLSVMVPPSKPANGILTNCPMMLFLRGLQERRKPIYAPYFPAFFWLSSRVKSSESRSIPSPSPRPSKSILELHARCSCLVLPYKLLTELLCPVSAVILIPQLLTTTYSFEQEKFNYVYCSTFAHSDRSTITSKSWRLST